MHKTCLHTDLSVHPALPAVQAPASSAVVAPAVVVSPTHHSLEFLVYPCGFVPDQ